jgi:hypothetical protein
MSIVGEAPARLPAEQAKQLNRLAAHNLPLERE